MRRGQALRVVIALLAGAILGIASAHWAIDRTAAAAAGPWRSWTGSGPYASAHFLLTGRLPPAHGIDMVFEANTDSAGDALDGDCDYVLKGRRMGARWWRIAVPDGIASVTSARAVGEPDGSTIVRVSQEPQPGNWLRLEDGASFALSLTLKTETARRSGAAIVEVPEIVRGECR